MIEKKPTINQTVVGWALLILPLILFFIFFINPLLSSFSFSLSKYKGLGSQEFIGLENFLRIFQDERFFSSLANSFSFPSFILRIILMVIAPLSIALLLMELRSGLRLTIQTVLCPIIVFSGAVGLTLIYRLYYSPLNMLSTFFNGEGYFFNEGIAIKQNLLLVSGLTWSIPAGILLFLSVMRGTNSIIVDKQRLYQEFWSQARRIIIIFSIVVTGFCISGLEAGYHFRLPAEAGNTLMENAFAYSLMMFRFGYGSALMQIVIIPLLFLGAGFMLCMEIPRSRYSLRMIPGIGQKLTTGAKNSPYRTVMFIVCGFFALLTVITFFFNLVLPWIGANFGIDSRVPQDMGRILPEVLAGMLRSYIVALPTALLCLALTGITGFAFGFLKPRGSKGVFILVGSFIFFTPVILTVPYLFMFKDIGALNTMISLILPTLISPLGIILFTLFFRGLRDEKNAQEVQRTNTNTTAMVIRSTMLFSIPMFALFLLISLNQVLLPLTMINNQDNYTLPLTLLRIMGEYSYSPNAGIVNISFLQYIVPLTLLIISIFIVFPRMALVTRLKAESASEVPAAEKQEKLKE